MKNPGIWDRTQPLDRDVSTMLDEPTPGLTNRDKNPDRIHQFDTRIGTLPQGHEFTLKPQPTDNPRFNGYEYRVVYSGVVTLDASR